MRLRQLFFWLGLMGLIFFAFSSPPASALENHCFCTSKTYDKPKPILNNNEVPTKEQCGTLQFIIHELPKNGLCDLNRNCKKALNKDYEVTECLCPDTTTQCKWRDDFCCCRELLGGRLACAKTAAYTSGGTRVCNDYSFRGTTEGAFDPNTCTCSPKGFTNPMAVMKWNVESLQAAINTGITKPMNADQWRRKEQDQADVCVGITKAEFFQLSYTAHNCSWDWGTHMCMCQVEALPMVGVSSKEDCDKMAADKERFASCEYTQGNLSQAGYIAKEVQADGTCVFPYDTGINAELLRARAQSLNRMSFSTPTQLIGVGIKILLSFVGSIALILYIYAGILWMTAAGNSEQITRAKQVIVWTTLGLVAMFGSYLLVNFVFNNLLSLKEGTKSVL